MALIIPLIGAAARVAPSVVRMAGAAAPTILRGASTKGTGAAARKYFSNTDPLTKGDFRKAMALATVMQFGGDGLLSNLATGVASEGIYDAITNDKDNNDRGSAS